MIILLIAISTLTALFIWQKTKSRPKNLQGSFEIAVTPLEKFNWLTAEPRQYRPIRPKYHMTMGISRLSFDDWLLIDKNYLSRITERKRILASLQFSRCVFANGCGASAVQELYSLVISHITRRYPKMFLVKDGCLYNDATKHTFPVDASQASIELLRQLTVTLEEDFLLLLKHQPKQEYCLEAATMCFPSHFSPVSKLGRPLTDIHGPVPNYKQKLQTPMNRYFDRLSATNLVQRFNWSIQAHSNLLALGSRPAETTDFKDAMFRVERQTLFRLPRTQAIVFTVRTYLTPLSQLKHEGLGDDLVAAIEAIPEDLAAYKGADQWGPLAIEYLNR